MTMSENQITLTINGKTATASPGDTLLQAARAVGIEIPTLCHNDNLAGFGACRLCVVEITAKGRSRVVASCLYPVEEGLTVETESEKIRQHRKIILEMMLARWPEMPLQLRERYGVVGGRMMDNTNFCIMCGLCVRHCSEVKKANVLGFVGRGTTRQVVAYKSLAKIHCPTCGGGEMECLAICPTGVLVNDASCPTYDPAKEKGIAEPVRMRDPENVKAVKKLVGDR